MPRLFAAGIAFTILLSGCSHYIEPPTDSTDAATLVGRGGAYVYRVDGEDVASARKVSPENGNRVRVNAGSHQLKVTVVGVHPATWNFKWDAKPAKTYLIEPTTGPAVGLTVTDQNTGRKEPVK